MKKSTLIFALAAVLIMATLAVAVGPGGEGAGPGACNGSGGCGGQGMMRGGCGGPGAGMMRGWNGDPKFFEETADLRKQLHDKRFEYREMSRSATTDEAALAQIEQEMNELRDQIRAKAPEGAWGPGQGRGPGGMMRGDCGGCRN